jgi:hypothetical protein
MRLLAEHRHYTNNPVVGVIACLRQLARCTLAFAATHMPRLGTLMKTFMAVLGICALSLNVSAQRNLQTFTSPAGIFQFKYWNGLVRCTLNEEHDGSSRDEVDRDACRSPAPLCSSGESSSIFACLAYPKERFREKPTFIAAAFFVSEIRGAATKETCLAGPKEWLTDSIGSTKLNAVTFTLFSISDNWLGGGQTGRIYRAFHNGGCYELGIQQAFTRPGGFDSGTIQKFTKRDQAEVDRRLLQALHSFRFLK